MQIPIPAEQTREHGAYQRCCWRSAPGRYAADQGCDLAPSQFLDRPPVQRCCGTIQSAPVLIDGFLPERPSSLRPGVLKKHFNHLAKRDRAAGRAAGHDGSSLGPGISERHRRERSELDPGRMLGAGAAHCHHPDALARMRNAHPERRQHEIPDFEAARLRWGDPRDREFGQLAFNSAAPFWATVWATARSIYPDTA